MREVKATGKFGPEPREDGMSSTEMRNRCERQPRAPMKSSGLDTLSVRCPCAIQVEAPRRHLGAQVSQFKDGAGESPSDVSG